MLSIPHWWDIYLNQVSMPLKRPLVLNSEQASTKYSANQIPRSKTTEQGLPQVDLLFLHLARHTGQTGTQNNNCYLGFDVKGGAAE